MGGFDKHLSDRRMRDVLTRNYEGKSLEYKTFLDFDSTDHKIKFCKEIISLANTGGGYLILGVTENKEKFERRGMPPGKVPDENELNDLVSSVLDDSVDVELRNFRHESDNFPIFYVPEANNPLIIAQYKAGDNEELNIGTIYWRDGGSASPLRFTNHIANFFSRFGHKIKDEEFISVEEHIERKTPQEKDEELISNVFSVEELPEKVYMAKTSVSSRQEGINRLISEHDTLKTDFITWEGKIVTFEDLSENNCRLKHLIEGPVAEKSFKDWREEQDAKHHIQLLNNSFNDYCRYRGLKYDTHKRRHFFHTEGGARKVYWYPNGGRPRTVVYDLDHYQPYAHKSLEGGFKEIEGEYYLYIDSSWTFTRDGSKEFVRDKIPNKITNKLQRLERNYQYLHNIKFWIAFLSNKYGKVEMGRTYNIQIDADPVKADIDVGAPSYKSDFKFEPDEYKVDYNFS